MLSLRHTSLSPDDPGTGSHGTRLGVGPQVQWRGDEHWTVAPDLIGNYISGRQAHFMKGYVGLRTAAGWSIGPEASLPGDSSYQIHSVGLALLDLRAGPLHIGVHVGVQEQAGLKRQINGEIEFSWYRP